MESTPSQNIGLIGGTGSCGTSLLVKIFELHPKIATVPEWRFLTDPDGIVDFLNSYKNWSPYHVDTRIKRLQKLMRDVNGGNFVLRYLGHIFRYTQMEIFLKRKIFPRYHFLNADSYAPNFEAFVQQLIDELTSITFSGYWAGTNFLEKQKMYYQAPVSKNTIIIIFRKFLNSIICDVLNNKNREFYVEKNTWNILWFDKILQLLPNAKLVHIYRDPRDVVASFSKQSWMPSDPESSAKIYKDLYDRWELTKAKLPNNSYLELSLEHLIEKPESMLKSICEFWGISWDNALLSTNFDKHNTGRWKKQFSRSDMAKVDPILRYYIECLGYE